MIKQIKDLKSGDNLYILEGYELSVQKISEVREFSPGFYKINWGFDDMQIIGEDCTSFSYCDKIVFLNKENVVSWLSGIINKIKETIEYVKKEN